MKCKMVKEDSLIGNEEREGKSEDIWACFRAKILHMCEESLLSKLKKEPKYHNHNWSSNQGEIQDDTQAKFTEKKGQSWSNYMS